MNFKDPILRSRNIELKEELSPIAFICPACDSEVSIKEIIEKNGRIGCIKCQV